MANERSYGRATHALWKRESTYGTAPAGNYAKIPFNRLTLGKRQGLVDSERAGAGLAMKEVYQDLPVVDGELDMPLCMRNIGYLLTALLGNPTTSGEGPYDHVFSSQTAALVTASCEAGHSSIPVYYMNKGVLVNTMTLNFERQGGAANAVFGLIAQEETAAGSTGGGTPTSQTLAVASRYKGSVSLGGSALGNLVSGNLTYSNNYDILSFVNSTNGEIAGGDRQDPTCTGQLTLRFANTTMMEAAAAKTPVDLDFTYIAGSDLELLIELHEVYLEKPVAVVEGPGGVTATFPFRAIYNVSASALATITLTNNLAGTTYTS